MRRVALPRRYDKYGAVAAATGIRLKERQFLFERADGAVPQNPYAV